MKTIAKFAAIAALFVLVNKQAQAQNTPPFWSLAGNSNATTASKLGTTNAIPLRLFTNNLERMRLTENGRLGIGVISPNAKLHVKGTEARIATFDGGTNTFIEINENGAPRGYVGSNAGNAQDFDIGTNSLNAIGKLHLTIKAVPKLTIDAGGKVGIGTTTPTTFLSVAKNTTGATADFRNTFLGRHISWVHFGPTGDWHIRSAADNGNVILQDQVSNGRVGIGTAV